MDEAWSAAVEAAVAGATSHRETVASLKEVLLANLVMVGEIPAETFKEEKRVRFILDRFREAGLDKISTDEASNALAVLPGQEGKRSLLVCAHLDTSFDEVADHTVAVETDLIRGAGIADNSLGVAVLCSLPSILQALEIRLKSDLILMGAAQGLGRGNLHGMDFFLDHHRGRIDAGICVEGVDLGRLSYQSIGMLRGEIVCRRKGSDLGAAPMSAGAIEPLAEVVRLIEEIPVPLRPPTTITLGAMTAGNTFHLAAPVGSLRFEVRSAKVGLVATIQEQIEEIVTRVGLEAGVDLSLEVIARRRNGGIDFGHPLTATTRRVMQALAVTPKVKPSVGELSSLIARDIPGVTLGITERAPDHEGREGVRIEPIFSGIAQLVAMLQAVDAGVCDGEEQS